MTTTEEAVVEKPKKKLFRKELKILIVFIGFIFIFRSSFYEPFRIPSGSMIPTLMVGDFIIVNKYSYGLKVPFSDFTGFGFNFNPYYLMKFEEPQRGDVIVFKFPKSPSVNFIKRIVAVPGDYVEIKNKVLYVNDEKVNLSEFDGTALKKLIGEKYQDLNIKFYNAITGQRSHIVQYDDDNYYRADRERKLIPEGKYFVLGDNRDFSHDSRFWGYVPEENIKGKAVGIWFSVKYPEIQNKNTAVEIRFNRIGKQIN